MMGIAVGHWVYMGATIGATYGTSVAISAAGDFIPYLSEGFQDEVQQIVKNSLEGVSGARDLDVHNKESGGSFEANVVYDIKDGTFFAGVDLLFATMLGSAAAYGSDVNVYKPLDNLGAFLNFGFRRSSTVVWEIISALCKSWELKGNADGVTLTTEWGAYDLKRSSTTITAANMATNQPAESPPRALFGDLTFFIADVADVLANADRIAISEFSLKCNNNMTDAEFATPLSTGGAAKLPIQTVRNGMREVTLELTLPRYDDADTYSAAYTAGTDLQAQLVFNGSGSNQIQIFLPWVRVEKHEAPITGAEVLTEKMTLRCLRGTDYADGVGNTVMVDAQSAVIVEEIAIQTNNERTAVPF